MAEARLDAGEHPGIGSRRLVTPTPEPTSHRRRLVAPVRAVGLAAVVLDPYLRQSRFTLGASVGGHLPGDALARRLGAACDRQRHARVVRRLPTDIGVGNVAVRRLGHAPPIGTAVEARRREDLHALPRAELTPEQIAEGARVRARPTARQAFVIARGSQGGAHAWLSGGVAPGVRVFHPSAVAGVCRADAAGIELGTRATPARSGLTRAAAALRGSAGSRRDRRVTAEARSGLARTTAALRGRRRLTGRPRAERVAGRGEQPHANDDDGLPAVRPCHAMMEASPPDPVP